MVDSTKISSNREPGRGREPQVLGNIFAEELKMVDSHSQCREGEGRRAGGKVQRWCWRRGDIGRGMAALLLIVAVSAGGEERVGGRGEGGWDGDPEPMVKRELGRRGEGEAAGGKVLGGKGLMDGVGTRGVGLGGRESGGQGKGREERGRGDLAEGGLLDVDAWVRSRLYEGSHAIEGSGDGGLGGVDEGKGGGGVGGGRERGRAKQASLSSEDVGSAQKVGASLEILFSLPSNPLPPTRAFPSPSLSLSPPTATACGSRSSSLTEQGGLRTTICPGKALIPPTPLLSQPVRNNPIDPDP